MINKDIAVAGYIAAALLTSRHRDEFRLYGSWDIEDCSRDEIRAEVDEFLVGNATLLLTSGMNSEQIGRTFWLARNGFGMDFAKRIGHRGQELDTEAVTRGRRALVVINNKLYHHRVS
ncbi:MAG: hypothetical protein EKK53_26670 [Burkholderiales bacterium]|nr:MAG: hypothetical protein EKK53_26670 [Burkholderiales bacterium]